MSADLSPTPSAPEVQGSAGLIIHEGEYVRRSGMTGKEFLAYIEATQTAAEARLDRTALVGKPVEEAKAWCQAHDFPSVLVEHETSVLSFAPGRVRLWVNDGGVVVEVHLG